MSKALPGFLALAITAAICTSQAVSFRASAAGHREDIGIVSWALIEESRQVDLGDRDTYTLQIVGANTLEVSITSDKNNAVFEIIGPNEKVLPCTNGGKCLQWSGPPPSGEHRIVVAGTRGDANYTLRISVK